MAEVWPDGNDMFKICPECNINKDTLIDYYIKAAHYCKECDKALIYYKENREARIKAASNYYLVTKESRKEIRKETHQKYYLTHKNQILEKTKIYYEENKDYYKQYRIDNFEEQKEKYKETKKKYRKMRAKTMPPEARLRSSVSRAIAKMLKNNNFKGKSKHLIFTVKELKKHLESKFESWMSWNNYGCYIPNKWDDTDTSTWTWQIDHIIPQSMLPYSSLKDENFKKCWNLENLRPYSSKQNTMDGISRIRHNIK